MAFSAFVTQTQSFFTNYRMLLNADMNRLWIK